MFGQYFESLEARGIILTEGQKRWYEKKAEVLGDRMKAEYPSTPEEAFEVNTQGLYYAAHISSARNNKRIIHIPYDPTLRVHSAWDLGFHDSTSIVLFQIAGKEIHVIDFLEGSGRSLAEWIKEVKKKDYVYGTHLAPHDIRVKEFSTGVSRIETATKLGVSFTIVPDVSIADGIDAVRNLFPRVYFNNSEAVLALVKHLENYSQKWDSSLGVWSGRPDHNSHSHAADCWRYAMVGLNYCTDEQSSVSQEQADNYYRQFGRRV